MRIHVDRQYSATDDRADTGHDDNHRSHNGARADDHNDHHLNNNDHHDSCESARHTGRGPSDRRRGEE